MRRGIVYVGGAARHWFDQSGALVADRIARSLRDKLGPDKLSYRIRVETDVHVFASGIGLDIASIEVAKGKTWEAVIDILEVKYLPRFTRRFAAVPAAARGVRALGTSLRWIWKILGEPLLSRYKGDQHGDRPPHLNYRQAAYMFWAYVATIGSLFYWIIIGLLALGFLGVSAASDVFGWIARANLILVGGFLILAEWFRNIVLEPAGQWGTETFAFMEYRLDDSHYLATPNAIRDAVEFAIQRGYTGVDLLTFSLGAVMATDAVFPRRPCPAPLSPGRTIKHWITIGYPYDQVRSSLPDYFRQRAPSVMDIQTWISIVVQDDCLGTDFRCGATRGITVKDSPGIRVPDINVPALRPERYVAPNRWDWIMPWRLVNHLIYWDDEDACAPTCFSEIVDAAGWTDEVRKVLQP